MGFSKGRGIQKILRLYGTPQDFQSNHGIGKSQFENLPGYSFEANYLEVDGMRMHYVDEGPRDGQVVLMLDGEPSWS
jgi:hypothetical protein